MVEKEVKDTCKGQADLLDQRICIGGRRSQAAAGRQEDRKNQRLGDPSEVVEQEI